MTTQAVSPEHFAIALNQARPRAFHSCLERARLAQPIVRAAKLSNAQLNGLVELATNTGKFDTVAKIGKELQKRNDTRWQADNKEGPGPRLSKDIAGLRQLADETVRQAAANVGRALGHAPAAPAPPGRDWAGELHLDLTRRYLTALVTLERVARGSDQSDR